MENNYDNSTVVEEFEDALSLCDFALSDDQESETNISYQRLITDPSTHEDFFEFSTSFSSSSEPDHVKEYDHIMFCGKIISSKAGRADHDNGHPKYNDPVSFSSSSSTGLLNKSKKRSNNPSSKLPLPLPPHAKSSSKKRHQMMIGLATIPSKMELSDLRERQNRKQTPPPMFPAVVGGDALAVSGDGSRRKSHGWGVLHGVASMLTRSSSFGCLRLARPCID